MPNSYGEGFKDSLELITYAVFSGSEKYLEIGERFMEELPKKDKGYNLGIVGAWLAYSIGSFSLVSALTYAGLECLK
jgi:hypothetical protein